MEERLLEIISNQASIINELGQLVQTLSSQKATDVVITGFKKASEPDAN